MMLSPRPCVRPAIDVKVVPMATSRFWLVRHLTNFWRWTWAVARTRADIFHAHYASDYGPWILGLLGKRPIALTAMGSDILHAAQGDMGWPTKWLTRHVLRSADLVISHSHHVAEIAVSQGARRDAIHLSLWGVDLRHYDRDEAAGMALRKKWNLSPEHFVVLSPRALDRIYCQDTVVEGLAAASGSRPLALVIPIGDQNDPRVLAIKALATRMGTDLRLVDRLVHREMPVAYSAADAVISMAASDNVPRTVLEAMACRTPVIARGLPDLDGLVIDGEHALLVDGRPAAIATAIERLSTDAALSKRLATAGRALVERKADLDHDTKVIVDRYRAITFLTDGGG